MQGGGRGVGGYMRLCWTDGVGFSWQALILMARAYSFSSSSEIIPVGDLNDDK